MKKHSKARKRAAYLIRKAMSPVGEKTMVNLSADHHCILCVDCGSLAAEWDHRDYEKPFDVDPVCCGCNVKRGPGLNAFEDNVKV